MKLVRLIGLVLMLCSQMAMAGSRDGEVNPNLDPVQLAAFSKQVERVAAKQGARVFLISRMGRPEKDLPEGVRFTHTAFAVYSMITLQNGKQVPGYAVYNLYQKNDKLSESHIVMDYVANFFDGAYELKAGVAVLAPELQSRVLDLIASGEYKKLHNPKYSVVSNPMNSRYQNCTEYVLDVLNAAIYQTTDIAQLKANTQAYFKPHAIGQSRIKLRLASLVMDDLTIADHKGKVKTTTYGSLLDYLRENGLLRYETTLYFDDIKSQGE